MRHLYAIFDKKATAYGPVVSAAHDAVATRDFVAACGDPNSSLARFAEDFEFHRLASLDERTGRIAQEGLPAVIVTASAVKAMNAAGPELLKEA